MAKTNAEKAAWAREYRKANLEKIRAAERARFERTKEQRAAQHRDWAARNPRKAQDASNKSTAAWRQRNREKTRAHDRLNYALKTGKLTKGPCEMGGESCDGKIHAHHDDYSKPLEVRWLCARHHRVLHGTEYERSPDVLAEAP